MFLPATKKELKDHGWEKFDIILVTGDTYIDSPFTGVAVIGKILVKHGFRVGIIAQPDVNSDIDIKRLGEPELFWGISAGAVDSMVANYTASKKWRKSDDYTPGGINNRRPDRAVIAYTNLVKKYFKNTCPIVLGGIEASLRRICHYDFWSNKIRRSILFDAKADYLVYGMAETSIVQLAMALKRVKGREKGLVKKSDSSPGSGQISDTVSGPESDSGSGSLQDSGSGSVSELSSISEVSSIEESISKIRGICYISRTKPENLYETQINYLKNKSFYTCCEAEEEPQDRAHWRYIEIPGFKEVFRDKDKFIAGFHTFYKNNDPLTASGLVQKQDSRFLIQNPPCFYPDTKKMDEICDLDFERDVHPFYKKSGKVKALDTIQFSISTHRGCYGECNFCAIAVHEGRTIRWRSEKSILREALSITKHTDFKGIISDAGGPTANMYGYECRKKLESGACRDKRCLFPSICKNLRPDHSRLIELFKKISEIKGVKKIFTSSGIRYDLVFNDKKYGEAYLKRIVSHHVSGQLKVAPEHSEKNILDLMGKPGTDSLCRFKEKFDSLSKKEKKKQFLTYYFIAAHPGCTIGNMEKLRQFIKKELRLKPEQAQIFTPTPSTYSTLMYYTERDPFSGKKIFVEKDIKAKENQKRRITGAKPSAK